MRAPTPDLAGPVAPPARRRRWFVLLFLFLGAAMALGLDPFGWWHIAFLALICVFVLFSHLAKQSQIFWAGWLTGLGYFGVALSWIVEPFFVDAATTGWMAPFALFLMAGGMALFWALAFWAVAKSAKKGLFSLAVFWAIAELARGYVLTGFPWAMTGYIWATTDAIQWVSVVGSYGLTFVSFLVAAAISICVKRGSWAISVPLAAGLVSTMIFGGATLRPDLQDLSDRPVIRLVQPNAAQHEKWLPDMIPVFFHRQLEFSGADWQLDGPPDLIVWPETAVPMLLNHADDAMAMISEAAGPAMVAVGIQREEQGDYYNSLAVLDPDGTVSEIYDKHHLVPFGEYMPAAWVFERLNIFGLAARAASAYTAGPGPDLLDLGKLGTARPLICYEAVFPNDVRAKGTRPDFMLQITNDAWFGNWSGPFQHLSQSRIRAIEQGLPMVRSANTGISAVIDGAGRIVAQIGLDEAGFVDAKLPLPSSPTVYSFTGDRVIFLILLACALFIYWKDLGIIPLTGRRTPHSRD